MWPVWLLLLSRKWSQGYITYMFSAQSVFVSLYLEGLLPKVIRATKADAK